jgi:DNA-binding transcriptional ArsR family regulator
MSLSASAPNSPSLALFGKARAAVLFALFRQEGEPKHLRQIAREGSIGPTALARELDAFLAAGIVIEKRVGNLRLFQANPQSPFHEPFRQLAAALTLSAKPADEEPARDEGMAPKTRKSERLGLSAPYDWPNPDIPDDALIAKAGSSLRFEDIAALCAHYGLDRVRSVLAKSAQGDLERKILARQLKNIEAAHAEEGDLAA